MTIAGEAAHAVGLQIEDNAVHMMLESVKRAAIHSGVLRNLSHQRLPHRDDEGERGACRKDINKP